MGLSSFLLKSSTGIDSELDALFKSQPSISETQSKKRKVVQDQRNKQNKRSKSDILSKQNPENQKAVSETSKKISSATPKKAHKTKAVDTSSEGKEEDNSDLENNYVQKSVSKKGFAEKGDSDHENDEFESDEDGDDEEGDPSNLVHESLLGKSKNKSKHGPKQKYAPPNETSEQRDRRTIFIGNVPMEVAQKRPLQKQLQRHILSFVPTARVESIRFRSVPFSTPTTKLPDSSEGIESPSSAPTANTKQKRPSQSSHSQFRASAWRENNPAERSSSATITTTNPTYLTPSQKKKIAFITHDFHSGASSVNAYLVFAHPFPLDVLRSHFPNAPDVASHPLAQCMDPYAAALDAVRKADGSHFMERVLRVDLVGKSRSLAGEEEGDVSPAWMNDTDPKRTLFVGNLDLESKEEDVRAFFEGLMKAERGGPPPATPAEGGKDEDEKPRTWVTRVRIIRDRDTQLGKGFCYVQFFERECVDEILALEPAQLKFAKRKLRVQRCKTIPGTKLKVSTSASATLTSPTSKAPNTKSPGASKVQSKQKSSSRVGGATAVTVPLPKGDPNLGNKLAHLSKEQRKQVKANDATRVARRLAKKKTRMAMGTKGKEAVQEGKDRVRVRKSGKVALVGGVKSKAKTKTKKPRVRSEKSLEKKNIKK